MRLAVTRVPFAVALAFALACGGSGGTSSTSPDAPSSVAAPAPVVEAPKPLFVDTQWDLSWTDRSESTDHIVLNADGTVGNLAKKSKVMGKWKADGRKFHLDWDDFIFYDGELSEDGLLITGTWKMEGDKGTWKAVPTTYVAKTPKPAGASSGGGLPSCYDVTYKCKAKSDDRSRTCWSSCSGNYGCQDACNETNRVERLECDRPTNCQ